MPVLNTVKDISQIPLNMKSFMIKFWIVNILGNLFLLVPLSMIVPIIFEKFRRIKEIIVLSLLVSVLIEFLRYLSMFLGNRRSVDIDDIILNTLSSIIGFGVYKICINNLHKTSQRQNSLVINGGDIK
jgi:glycopeptide antibiotics resistance protein